MALWLVAAVYLALHEQLATVGVGVGSFTLSAVLAVLREWERVRQARELTPSAAILGRQSVKATGAWRRRGQEGAADEPVDGQLQGISFPPRRRDGKPGAPHRNQSGPRGRPR